MKEMQIMNFKSIFSIALLNYSFIYLAHINAQENHADQQSFIKFNRQ